MSRVRTPDRPSRLGMLARRQKRTARRALLAVPLAGLAVVAVLAVRGAVDQAGTGSWIRHEVGMAMPIRHIVVTGEQLTSVADIEHALDLPLGTPIMAFSPDAAEQRVDQLPFVETATVSRDLPGTVRVVVRERTPYAVWQDDGRFVLIDRTGKVVQDQGLNGKDAEAFERLPLVVGHGAPEAAAALIAVLDTAPTIRSHVVAAVRVGDRRWNLDLRNGCQVLLPEAEAAPAIARLAALEGRFQLLERPLAVIDMRLADRLTIRPDAAPATAADVAPSGGGGGHTDDGHADDGRKPA